MSISFSFVYPLQEGLSALYWQHYVSKVAFTLTLWYCYHVLNIKDLQTDWMFFNPVLIQVKNMGFNAEWRMLVITSALFPVSPPGKSETSHSLWRTSGILLSSAEVTTLFSVLYSFPQSLHTLCTTIASVTHYNDLHTFCCYAVHLLKVRSCFSS